MDVLCCVCYGRIWLKIFGYIFPQDLIEQIYGDSLEEKLVLAWQQLQSDVDHLMDSGMNQSTQKGLKVCPGIKQVGQLSFCRLDPSICHQCVLYLVLANYSNVCSCLL